MDLNALNKTLSDGVTFLGKLMSLLEQQSNAANIHGSISGTVAIVKTLQGTAVSFTKLLAASDQMIGWAELKVFFGRLGDAYAEVVTDAVNRLALPERERLDLRDFIIDETNRRFAIEGERFQAELTERRRQGTSALENPKLLEND